MGYYFNKEDYKPNKDEINLGNILIDKDTGEEWLVVSKSYTSKGKEYTLEKTKVILEEELKCYKRRK